MTLDTPAKQGGAALLAIAAVVLAYVVFTGKDDKGASCKLTAAGLAALAVSAHQQQSAAQIVGLAAIPLACEALVSSVVDEPEEQVSVDVELPQGETTTLETTGTQLIEPPSAPAPSGSLPPGRLEQLLACLRWKVDFLFQSCADGRIGPPATSY